MKLEFRRGDEFISVADGITDADGRVRDWKFELHKGTYRLRFEIAAYFENLKEKYFYPYVEIIFNVDNAEQHYHVPLLLSAYGFSTYRGS